MGVKSAVRQLVPPVIFNLYKDVRLWLDRRRHQPEWCKVTGGPAKGCWLYVPPGRPGFRDMLTGAYDDWFWRFLAPLDLESRIVLDVGGHIGYDALCFAALCGDRGKVYVFEPNASNRDRMELILERNAAASENIEVRAEALADFQGQAELNFSSNVDDQTSSGAFLAGDFAPPLEAAIYGEAHFTSSSVRVDTLDHFVQAEGLENVRLVKIDVEGAEHKVIEGGKETIERQRPVLLIEVHSVAAMLHTCRTLHALDYQIKLLAEDRASRCHIAAFSQDEEVSP
jgi:FkbM family methyltransferase